MDMKVEEGQFRRLEKINKNSDSGLDEQVDDDMDAVSDKSLEPRRRESSRRRAECRRATESRQERRNQE